MAEDRGLVFLKVAVKNKLISSGDAEKVLSSWEQRQELGVERSVQDIIRARKLLTDDQIAKIDSALRATLPPEQIAGFRILEKVGQGAVGTVYKARQLSLDKVVAVKVLHERLAKKAIFVEQFIREARAVGSINHPHIVHAIDAGQSDGYCYFAMEFVEGETLKNRLKRKGKLTESETLDIARCIAQGISNAHDNGTLHRDLKPDNILLGRHGQVKIADLGLAMPLDDQAVLAEELKRMGSPYYMSPEQSQGKEIDARSDLYALGATLYHAVVGKPPFTGQSIKEILTKHVHQDPVPPREAGAKVSAGTEEFLLRLLQKEPDKRVQNAHDLVAAINDAERNFAPSAPPAPRAPRRPTRSTRREVLLPDTNASDEGALPVRYQYVFTKVGLGGGIAIALIFVLMGFARNKSTDESAAAQSNLLEDRFREKDALIVKQRIENWKADITKKSEDVSKAIEMIERNATSDPARLRGLEHLLTQNPDSYAALKVVERIDDLKSTQRNREVAGANEYFERTEELRNKGRLWKAVLELDSIPKSVLTSRALEDQRDRLIEELEKKIDSKYEEDIAQVKEFRQNKDYQQALDRLELVKEYADPETVKDSENFYTEIAAQLATYKETESKKRTEEETQKYGTFVKLYKGLCQERRFKDCISRALELETEMTTEEVTRQLELDFEAFQKLDKLLRDAREALTKEIGSGKEITLVLKNKDRYTGQVARVESDQITLTLKQGGGTADFPIPFPKISDQALFTAVEDLHGPRSADYLIPLGILFTYRGELSVAQEHFRLAQEAGHATATQKWVDKLEWMRQHGGN